MTEPGLTTLKDREIPSELHPGVSFKLQHQLGEGGMGVAFFALRQARDGVTPCVVKIVRPEIVANAGTTAALMIQKEAIALGRLNERVPPTPFVIRFLDNGTVETGAFRRIKLPWIALEYVYGGPEGTTLEERVQYSLQHTGYAFDCQRAAHAIECISEGLTAIHDSGVVHRDLTPGNVLCCGFGHEEVFKIADFGIARPAGVAATFGNVLLGTPGYASPEQTYDTESKIGPWSDVFSLAAVVFFMLTGEQYFETGNVARALLQVQNPARRSLREAPRLPPELRASESAYRAIDAALAKASSHKPQERPPAAAMFASSVVPWLRSISPRSQRASERLIASVAGARAPVTLAGWNWTVRHPPGDDRLIRSAAWDADRNCLAVTTQGLEFWNGTGWVRATTAGLSAHESLRCVSLLRPGLWLVGAADGSLFLVGSEGVTSVIRGPEGIGIAYASGDPNDLAVVVGERPGVAPLLYTVAARRFFRPLILDMATAVTGLARVDDTRWLLCGRTTQGSGFAACYSALSMEAGLLPTPHTDALTACAGHLDRGLGVAVGRRGIAIRTDGVNTDAKVVESAPDLAATDMDVRGRCWAGGFSMLWTLDPQHDKQWVRAWQNQNWQVPLVSLRADVGVVTAVAVDGAVIEGRGGQGAQGAGQGGRQP